MYNAAMLSPRAGSSIDAYDDALWGHISLNEPVLAELVASKPVVRLKGIMQAGASAYLLPHKQATTRFDHSLGVMHILAQMGASLEEQVAGLLHDLPHTAFSHTVDALFPSVEHNFHESFHEQVVSRSEIPEILERYGVPLVSAIEPDNYPLLEQPLPNLCADRIDYTLRDRHAEGKLTTLEAQNFLETLVVFEGRLVIRGIEAALWFARHFVEANRSSWTAPDEAGAYWALASAMRRAYSLGRFTEADLFSTDDQAMAVLQSINDTELHAYLALLTPGTHFQEVEGAGHHFCATMKQRVIDPHVLESEHTRPRRLSTLSSDYAALLRSLPPGPAISYRLWSESISPEILHSSAVAPR